MSQLFRGASKYTPTRHGGSIQGGCPGNTKTKSGALLLELKKGEKPQPELHNALKTNLRGITSVSEVKQKATIEIRDLDS